MGALACGGGGGGPPPLPEAPKTPFWDDPACLPTDHPTRSPSHELVDSSGPHPEDFELGRAVEVALFGPESDDALHADVVVGAPGFEDATDRTGQVRLVSIDRATGNWATLAPHRPEQELEPPVANAHRFGAAVLAANYHPTRPVSPGSPFSPEPDRVGRGHELLVGAPTSSASSGSAVTGDVFGYATRVDGPAYVGTDSRADWEWNYVGMLNHGLGENARFGHSLATSRRDGPDDLVPWIAVGAPGANVVSIYALTLSGGFNVVVPDPVQQITPAMIGASGIDVFDFGFALAADDFNQDGILDLAIGAPGGPQYPARVIVIPGIEVGSPTVQRLDPANATILQPTFADSPTGDVSRFGAALDAGDLFAPLQTVSEDIEFARSLAIGAPHHINAGASGRGGVCWVAFLTDLEDEHPDIRIDNVSTQSPVTDQPTCATSPYDVVDGEFGTAVAIADVSPIDALLFDHNVEARTHELVVGAPRVGRVQWSSTTVLCLAGDGETLVECYPYDVSEPDPMAKTLSGNITILRGDPASGPFVFTNPASRETRSLAERWLHPDVTEVDSRFGSAIRVIDAQRSGRPDLVVGAPNWNKGRGSVQLLNSAPFNGVDLEFHGDFRGADSAMSLHDMRMVETPSGVYVRVEGLLTVSFVDGPTVCLVNNDFDATATFPLSADFPHELLGSPTDLTLPFTAGGAQIRPEDFDPEDFDDFEAFRLDIRLTDRFFDNPSVDDQLEFLLSNVEFWYCGDWRNPQENHGYSCYLNRRMVDASCTINNNPFHFDRLAYVVETCE